MKTAPPIADLRGCSATSDIPPKGGDVLINFRVEPIALANACHNQRQVGLADAVLPGKPGDSEPPPHHRILRIAKVCNVDPGWLAYWPNTSAKPPGEGGVGDFEQAAAESSPAPRGTPSIKNPVPRPGESDEGTA